MDLEKLKAEIIQDEGRKKFPYKDMMGIWTAGIGRNLEAHGASWQDIATWLKTGIPDAVIDGWFAKDVQEAIVCCKSIFQNLRYSSRQRTAHARKHGLRFNVWP